MTVSLQVLYPATSETTFDFDYYQSKHMALVGKHMGPHIANTVIVKGQAGADGTPAAYHAVATILFDSQADMDSAMAQAGPVVADIPEFYNAAPQMLVGAVLS